MKLGWGPCKLQPGVPMYSHEHVFTFEIQEINVYMYWDCQLCFTVYRYFWKSAPMKSCTLFWKVTNNYIFSQSTGCMV